MVLQLLDDRVGHQHGQSRLQGEVFKRRHRKFGDVAQLRWFLSAQVVASASRKQQAERGQKKKNPFHPGKIGKVKAAAYGLRRQRAQEL
jgi:hypothetical protein